MTAKLLQPEVKQPSEITSHLKNSRERSKSYYDRHVKEMPELKSGDTIRYRTDKIWTPAKLISPAEKPRSYVIKTPAGREIIRNRKHLLRTKESDIYAPERERYLFQETMAESTGMRGTQTAEERQQQLPITNREPQRDTPSVSVEHPTAAEHRARPDPEPSSQTVTRSGRVSKPPVRLRDYVHISMCQ